MKEPSEFRGGPTRQPGPGTRLSGIYEIESLLATGGMGEVWRGRAIETGAKVAIKTIRPEMAARDKILALFRKEAAALNNLQHDAIVRYYVFTTDPELGAPYLAMELVEGESLSDILRSGPLPLHDVRVLQHRLASGLEAAHRQGVVHRDLSPDNIIVPDGDFTRAKLIDFGIARSGYGGDTVIGENFAGKANFASPEQVGLFGAQAGPRSDIYSLGLTLAAAALGEPLDMGGTQVELVRKRQKLPDLARIEPSMRALLLRMLAPKPEDRIGSMAEVSAFDTTPKRGTRRPGWLLPAVAAGLLLVLGAVLFGWHQMEGPSGPAAPLPPVAALPPETPSRQPERVVPPEPAPASRAEPEPAVAPPPPAETRTAQAPPPEPVTAASPSPAVAPPLRTTPGAFRDCPTCPEMVPVPAGTFSMGVAGSAGDPTERPAHDVAIRRFAAGRLPVTVGEWRRCVADRGCVFEPDGEDDAPVHNVSWDDTLLYLAWLSRGAGRPYRLLTEAEWEYAARAGSKARYWWGDQFRSDLSSCRGCTDAPARNPPVAAKFRANPFGLHDVTGSVAQWVEDCWHRDYRGAPRDGSAWTAPGCRERVLRGGSWMNDAPSLRITSRDFYDPAVRYPGHGFRVARDM